MNGRVVKKIRKEFRRGWKRYYNEMCDLGWRNRLLLCWDIMRRDKFI